MASPARDRGAATAELVMVLPAKEARGLSTELALFARLWLCAKAGEEPSRALVTLQRDATAVREETRVIHDGNGAFSTWVADVMEGATRALSV